MPQPFGRLTRQKVIGVIQRHGTRELAKFADHGVTIHAADASYDLIG